MIAWLAARCDQPDYGTLIVYEFRKEKLVYGPFQIEARINQNTEISQQISLWNQMGSRVEQRCGAVALGWTYPFPPLSSGGASVVLP
jgi:uncharacterized membrane protein (UPF0182 family)